MVGSVTYTGRVLGSNQSVSLLRAPSDRSRREKAEGEHVETR